MLCWGARWIKSRECRVIIICWYLFTSDIAGIRKAPLQRDIYQYHRRQPLFIHGTHFTHLLTSYTHDIHSNTLYQLLSMGLSAQASCPPRRADSFNTGHGARCHTRYTLFLSASRCRQASRHLSVITGHQASLSCRDDSQKSISFLVSARDTHYSKRRYMKYHISLIFRRTLVTLTSRSVTPAAIWSEDESSRETVNIWSVVAKLISAFISPFAH